jgi:hypothetical protein
LKRIDVGHSTLLLVRKSPSRFEIEQGKRSQSTP